MVAPSADVEGLIQRLIDAGSELPDELAAAVLAPGAASVPALIRVLEDDALGQADAPGGGYAPIHAAALLHALRAPEAIEPMLRQVARGSVTSILHERLDEWLPNFGIAALEPAWAIYTRADDLTARRSLRRVMARLGVRDARVFRELLANLETEPDRAAMDLYDYGDPAALPHLERAFLALELDDRAGRVLGNHVLIELKATIEELGGALTEEMNVRFVRGDAMRRAAVAEIDAALATPVRRATTTKVGRNDPCPCGNRRKYKKCHGA